MDANVILQTPGTATLALRRASKKVFGDVLKSLPGKQHHLLRGRTIVNTRDAVVGKVVTINQFCHLLDRVAPVDTQRDHERRAEKGEAAYLAALHLTHLSFLLAVNPETGAIQQVDGNTRGYVWFKPGSQACLPSHVSLTVYFPDTTEMLRDAYYCTDSQSSTKRMAHHLQSCYRDAGGKQDKLVSELMKGGHWSSAAYRLANVHSIGSIRGVKNRRNLARLVKMYVEVIPWLDRFKLRPLQLSSQGYIGAFMWLARQTPGDKTELTAFINDIIMGTTGHVQGISRVVKDLFREVEQLTPGGKGNDPAIDAVFAACYEAYRLYLLERARLASAAERRRLIGLANSYALLPSGFRNKLEALREAA